MAEHRSPLRLVVLLAAGLAVVAGVRVGGALLITRAADTREFRAEEVAYAAGQAARGGLAKRVVAGELGADSLALAGAIHSAIRSPRHLEVVSLGQARPSSLLHPRVDVLTMADISAWYSGAVDGSWFTAGRIMPFTADAGWNSPRMSLVLGSGAVLLGLVTYDPSTGNRKVALLHAFSSKKSPGPGELTFQYVHSIPGVPAESLFVPPNSVAVPYERISSQVAAALRRTELQAAKAR